MTLGSAPIIATPLRSLRFGSSYLHAVTIDAMLPYHVDAAARLLAQHQGILRAQYDAAMIPPGLHYLLHPAYDYGAAQRSSSAPLATQAAPVHTPLTNWPVPESTPRYSNSPSQDAPHRDSSRLKPESLAEIGQHLEWTQAATPKVTHGDSADPRLPSVAIPRPAAPPARSRSLADLGRALEAHNFPIPTSLPQQNKHANGASTVESLGANSIVATPSRTQNELPNVALRPASLPTTHIAIPGAGRALHRDEPLPNSLQQPLQHRDHSADVDMMSRPSLHANSANAPLPALAQPHAHSTITLPSVTTAEARRREAAVTQAAALSDQAFPSQAKPVQTSHERPDLTSIKRKVLRERLPEALTKKGHAAKAKPQKQRAAARPVAARSTRQAPLAFLERSQLAQMRLRMFR